MALVRFPPVLILILILMKSQFIDYYLYLRTYNKSTVGAISELISEWIDWDGPYGTATINQPPRREHMRCFLHWPVHMTPLERVCSVAQIPSRSPLFSMFPEM